jgi:hypothetical protein
MQVVFPKRSCLVAPQNSISWTFPKLLEPIVMKFTQQDFFHRKPIDSLSCCASAQLAFDNIMLLHKHILPRWLDVGEVIRVALSCAVASCSPRFRSMPVCDPSDGSPLKIVFHTNDQEPVLVIVQTMLSQLCKIFEISFGIVYPNTICVSRESKLKNEDSGFATTLHLLRSGVVLIPQIQELFSDTKVNSSKIDIIETIANSVQVPGTCIIGIWCDHGSESSKSKTSNQVRLEKMWDLQFCCKESAKTESLIGFLESAVVGIPDHSSDVFKSFISEAQSKFSIKTDRVSSLQLWETDCIFTAYAKSVSMLTSAAVPVGFSVVKRECNPKHLTRILRAIQCSNFEVADVGDCILAYVHAILMT